MLVTVDNHLDDLADDTKRIATKAFAGMVKTVREGVKVGNSLARDDARRRLGQGIGRHYPRAFSFEVKFAGFGSVVGEYGPDKAKWQGGMLFEDAQGKQTTPHRSLARSLDVGGPAFRGEVRALPGKWFW